MSTIISLRFEFDVLDDLHTGTGTGILGLVDDAQSRDQRRRPAVWSTTLRGVLRETIEDWLLALRAAGEDISAENRLLKSLLGAPPRDRESAQDQEPAEGSEQGSAVVLSLRQACASSEALSDTDNTIEWTTTARKAGTRMPAAGSLRRIEFTRAGTLFAGEIRLEDESTNGPKVQLLLAGLQRLEALGSRKTRGSGRVRLVSEELKVAEIVAGAGSKLAELTAALPEQGPVRLRVLLRNLEPLSLTKTGFAGNILPTESCISGSRLRGALLTALSNDGNSKLADRLAAGALRVGNAYVVATSEEERKILGDDLGKIEILPLPLTVEEEKPKAESAGGASGEAPWWAAGKGSGIKHLHREGKVRDAAADADKECSAEEEEEQYKRIKTEEYLLRIAPSQAWRRVKPRLGVVLRNQVPTLRRDARRPVYDKEDKFQPGDGVGIAREDGLFSQEVLWEDQFFLTDLLFADRASADAWLTASAALLADDVKQRAWLRVGRSGRPVRIEHCCVMEAEPPQPAVAPNPNVLTITFTSDLIARTPWLTFLTQVNLPALARIVEEAGGGALPHEHLQLDGKGSRFEGVEIRGYNAASGVTRATAVAIRRGSVCRITAEGSDAERQLKDWREALAKLARAGEALGERTAEGFGRFALDLDLHTPAYWAGDERGEMDPAPEEDAQLNWREAVMELLAGKLDECKQFGLSVTQWQWLRERAKLCREESDINSLLEEIGTHARRLSGIRWKDLLGSLRGWLGECSGIAAKRFFLDQLAQAMTAHLRRERKNNPGGNRQSQEQGANA